MLLPSEIRNIVGLPFGWVSRVRRYVLNGTLEKVVLNTAIYTTISYLIARYLIKGDLGLLHNVLHLKMLPSWAMLVAVPLICAITLYVIRKLYTQEVKERELDIHLRGGKKNEKSDLEKDALAIELTPIFNGEGQGFSIFIPVSNLHKQGDILEIIAIENRDKVFLVSLQYVCAAVIVYFSMAGLHYYSNDISGNTLMLAGVVSILFIICTVWRTCRKSKDDIVNHEHDYVKEIGNPTWYPFWNIFLPFKKSKVVAVTENMSGMAEDNLLSMILGSGNTQKVCSILDRFKQILDGKVKLKSTFLTPGSFFRNVSEFRFEDTSNQSQQAETDVNIHDIPSAFLRKIKQDIKFTDNTGDLTLHDIPVETVIHKKNGVRLKINSECNIQRQMDVEKIKWKDNKINEAWHEAKRCCLVR